MRQFIIRGLSVLCVVLGVGIISYFAYDYFGGDIRAKQTHSQELGVIEEKFATATPQPEPTPTATTPKYGETYATLRVPRFDSDGHEYRAPIAEGTERDVIDYKGVGHYELTNQFGEVGNVGLAAHRNGDGALFSRITELQSGDKIFVDTSDGTYTYIYDRQEERDPTEVSVLLPVPNKEGVKPTEELLTLTTCGWWDNSSRVVAYAHFDSFEKR